MSEGWNAGRIIYACAQRFDWWANKMMTEFEIDGGRADLVFITKAGYLTEIEVKISKADWNADRDKAKWKRARPHVARFFYAIPETLEASIPDWLPPEVGIIKVCSGEGRDYSREIRPAKRLKAEKVPDRHMQLLVENCYYRFWRAEMRRMGSQLYRSKQRELAASPIGPS